MNFENKRDIEEMLIDALYEVEDLEDADINTFSQSGLLTMDNGLVIRTEDGTEIVLTIQAYKNRRSL